MREIHRDINVIMSDISLRGREDDLLRAGCVLDPQGLPAVPGCHATCTTVLAISRIRVLAGPQQAPVRKRIREIAKTWNAPSRSAHACAAAARRLACKHQRVRRLARAAERLGANYYYTK